MRTFPLSEERLVGLSLLYNLMWGSINRSRSRRRDVAARPKGEDRNINGRIIVDFAGTPDDDSSPKKRKRDERESGSEGESGNWVEVEEDEEEPPDFIAESE